EVADLGQLEAAGQGEAGDRGDRRLPAGFDDTEDAVPAPQEGIEGVAVGGDAGDDGEVGPGAESPPLPGQHDGPHGRIGVGLGEMLLEQVEAVAVERVQLVRPVQGDGEDRPVLFGENLHRPARKSGVRFSAKARAPSCPSSVLRYMARALDAMLARPAWCSVSTLKDRLRNSMAVGLFSAISAAQAFASSSSRSAGTTALTRPQRSAVAAS